MCKLGARALLAGALWSAGAAGSSPDVLLREQGCQDYDEQRLGELLAIEVETIRSELASRPSDVMLECRDGIVSIRVALRDGSAARTGEVDPRTTAQAARTRLLALTITELLAQLWSDTPPKSLTTNERTPPTKDRATTPSFDTTQNELVFYAAAAFRSMLEPRAALFGGALGAEYQISSAIALAADLEGNYAQVDSAHADVNVLLASAAVHAAIGRSFGHLALGVGPGARLGWVNLSPRNLEPNAVGSDVSGVWAGPLLIARAKWSESGFVLYSRFEAGIVTLPVVGTINGQAAELELRGPWLALCAGVGASF